jgi:hypothetical protein
MHLEACFTKEWASKQADPTGMCWHLAGPGDGGTRFVATQVRVVAREQRLAIVERPRSLSLTQQCKMLGSSRAALYYQPVEVSPRELTLMALIDRQYLRTPFYGSRMTVSLSDGRATLSIASRCNA